MQSFNSISILTLLIAVLLPLYDFQEMLKDTVRTKGYMKAIVNNPHLFKDKIVLDVGCGTGILCMFAVKAGAKHVYGIECAGIIQQAQQIINDNNCANKITLIKGKVEEISLPVDKVDIIISEWMGYFLLYESMLDTVLYARDKWLNTGGLIFPDKAQLFLTAIEDAEYREDKINFWDNVYGYNMQCIKQMAMIEPLVDTCDPKQVISTAKAVLNIDIYTVKKEELDFTADYELEFARDDYFHALVAYFDVEFSKTHAKLAFSTGPKSQYTHWKQTVFYLNEAIAVNEGEKVVGTISVKRNSKNPRDLDIEISYAIKGKTAPISQSYRLR
jgi:protein arginine N-methyltransferase 1